MAKTPKQNFTVEIFKFSPGGNEIEDLIAVASPVPLTTEDKAYAQARVFLQGMRFAKFSGKVGIQINWTVEGKIFPVSYRKCEILYGGEWKEGFRHAGSFFQDFIKVQEERKQAEAKRQAEAEAQRKADQEKIRRQQEEARRRNAEDARRRAEQKAQEQADDSDKFHRVFEEFFKDQGRNTQGFRQQAPPRPQPNNFFSDNPFVVLGLATTAGTEEIHKTWRKLCAIYHPDNVDTGNEEILKRINNAHDTLKDPFKRQMYAHQWR